MGLFGCSEKTKKIVPAIPEPWAKDDERRNMPLKDWNANWLFSISPEVLDLKKYGTDNKAVMPICELARECLLKSVGWSRSALASEKLQGYDPQNLLVGEYRANLRTCGRCGYSWGVEYFGQREVRVCPQCDIKIMAYDDQREELDVQNGFHYMFYYDDESNLKFALKLLEILKGIGNFRRKFDERFRCLQILGNDDTFRDVVNEGQVEEIKSRWRSYVVGGEISFVRSKLGDEEKEN